jgi:hypothetical protein
MIDAEGKPQRLYHITAAGFIEFKPGGHDPRLSGRVIYLTPYPHDIPAGHNVRGTVRGERYRPGTNVMPVYASIQRPLYIFDADDAQYAERFRLDSFAFPRSVSDKSLAALKEAGYDGIVYGGYRDAEGFDIYTGRNVEIIAFEPTQIKSAIGNRGTFDPEDPNIMHNPRRKNPKPTVRYDEDTGELLVASGSGVRLTKLGGMRSDAARVSRLAELVPERATHAFALHPANWQRTYTSLTGKDLDKVTRYKPEPISLVPGTLVGEMKHANAYLWYGDDADAIRYQQSVQRLEDADIAAYRMPELLVPRTNPRRALRFVRPPRRVVRRNGLGMERSVTPSPAVAAFVKEWNARDMDTVFADMGVRVDVGLEGGDYIELEMIEALRPGRGNGGRALRALLDLVDKHNLGITLIAMPFHRYDAEGNPLPGLDDLVRIYQRFGFRLLEDAEDEEEIDEDEEPESYPMERPPRRNPRRR